MIFTFYSFKGGVGRSMALANIAEWFYRKGLCVVMVDWDLEAPGLESFFHSEGLNVDTVRGQVGVIDLLTEFKQQFPSLTLQPKVRTGEHPMFADDEHVAVMTEAPAVLDVVKRLEALLPPLSTFFHPVHPPRPAAAQANPGDKPAALWLLPAGARAGDRFEVYADLVQSFDWNDFYESYQGEAYFEWMRSQLDSFADVVLIDSRTGVTEMGGVCAQQLADVVVTLCAPNEQNQSGTETMIGAFVREELGELRRRTERGPIDIVVVPSRVDRSDKDRRNTFIDGLDKRVKELEDADVPVRPPPFRTRDVRPSLLELPYTSAYSYEESIIIDSPTRDRELETAYKRLGAHLALLAPDASAMRSKLAGELRPFYPELAPRVTIAHTDDPHEVMAAERLLAVPDLAGISVRRAPILIHGAELEPAVPRWLTDCEHLILIVAPGSVGTGAVRQLWGEARRRGICVHVVSVPMDGVVWRPPWLAAGADWMEAPQDPRGWRSLCQSLAARCVAVRMPLMAPPARQPSVVRSEAQAVKDALIAALQGRGMPNVIVEGAAGSGKTVLAQQVCTDDDILAAFPGGILWVRCADIREANDGALKRQLELVFEALTGVPRSFERVVEAVTAIVQQLHHGPYLLVLDEVVTRALCGASWSSTTAWCV